MSANFVDKAVTTGTGPFSADKPPLTASGDVQLAFIVCDGTGATLGISGGGTWNQIGSTQNVSNGDTQTFALFWQVAGGSEPSTYPITSTAALPCTVAIVAYDTVDTTGSPIAAQLATNPNSASPPASPVSIDANAITTTANNQTVVWFGMVDWSLNTAASFSDPAGTNRRAVGTPAAFTNALVVDFVQTTAGSTGTVSGSGTLATASGNFGAWMVALLTGTPPTSNDILMGQICL